MKTAINEAVWQVLRGTLTLALIYLAIQAGRVADHILRAF